MHATSSSASTAAASSLHRRIPHHQFHNHSKFRAVASTANDDSDSEDFDRVMSSTFPNASASSPSRKSQASASSSSQRSRNSSESPSLPSMPPLQESSLEAAATTTKSSSAAVAAVGEALLGLTPSATRSFSSPAEKEKHDEDKRVIYEHPLFPLLAFLFEECEKATNSIEFSTKFRSDLQSFVQEQIRDKKPLMSDNHEANELMKEAIINLRIHLMELEKVQELCDNFCQRYIDCLRSKMQSENLLRSDNYQGSGSGGYDSGGDESSPRPPQNIQQQQQQMLAAYMQQHHQQQQLPQLSSPLSSSGTASAASVCPPPPSAASCQLPTTSPVINHESTFPSFVHEGGDAHFFITPIQQPQQQLHQHEQQPQQVLQSNPLLSAVDASSFTLPSVLNYSNGLFGFPANSNFGQIAASVLSDEFDDDHDSDVALAENEENGAFKTKVNRKCTLPKESTAVLKAWLFEHLMDPYPAEEEKKDLSSKTRLTISQINTWFINARRRIFNSHSSSASPPALPPFLATCASLRQKSGGEERHNHHQHHHQYQGGVGRLWATQENMQNFYPIHEETATELDIALAERDESPSSSAQ